MHALIDDYLARYGTFLTDKFVCPHHPEKGFPGERLELKIVCDCRKPHPGMLLQAQKRYNLDMSRSFMIGDRIVDIMAGVAAGCQSFLLCENIENVDACRSASCLVFKNLPTAAAHIIKS